MDHAAPLEFSYRTNAIVVGASFGGFDGRFSAHMKGTFFMKEQDPGTVLLGRPTAGSYLNVFLH